MTTTTAAATTSTTTTATAAATTMSTTTTTTAKVAAGVSVCHLSLIHLQDQCQCCSIFEMTTSIY